VDSGRSARVALVLGAGGVVGHAFHVGVLNALAEELGWDPRGADLIVGTSAGSVVGASLRAGLSPADSRRRLAGEPLSPHGAVLVGRAEEEMARLTEDGDGDDNGDVDVDEAEQTALAIIARRLRIASPERVRRALRAPWRVSPGSLASALLPAGRRPTAHLRAPHEGMLGDRWPAATLWIVAVDLDVGPRVVFGRAGAPLVTVGQAVEASCAVPGYFAPVSIDGTRYVDGGMHSTTNADLVASLEPPLDLAIVSAPMSAVTGSVPRSQAFSIRHYVRRQLAGEVAALRAAGVVTITFQPTAADLAVMAGNTMDPSKASAVCEQVVGSTRHHLRRGDVVDRLTPLRR
jgi:NTE family protein